MGSRLHRLGGKTRKVLAGAVLLALAAWLVPSYVSAERYRRRLEAGLEQALKRPVAFGAVSFRLLPHPGFAIENVLIREDPRFGVEPFAHVERIDCDLSWRSLAHSRLEFSRLRLERPTLNLVRDARGEWNVESLLRESGIASPGGSGGNSRSPASLALDVDGARIDFKIGDDKKPWAITDLRAQLNFDPSRGLLRYRLMGRPVRTDLALAIPPSPGEIELAGDWTPGRNLGGPIDATLRAPKAVLYNWVPLITGRNPGVYGVMDLAMHFTGSVRNVIAEGDSDVSQLYRSDLLPPSDSTHFRIHFRGELDRTLGRAVIETSDIAFADSHLYVTGSVSNVFDAPDLDLAVVIGRSRLENFLALARHFWTSPTLPGSSGFVDGLVAIQGPWLKRRYGGLITARDASLNLPSGRVAMSDAVLRIDNSGVRLAPVRLTVAPRVELVAEGFAGYAVPLSANVRKVRNSRNEPDNLFRINKPISNETVASGPESSDPPRYEITLAARSVPLADLVRLARSAGVHVGQGIEAKSGTASGTFHLNGLVWPPQRPSVEGRVEVESAGLLVPGVSEPLDISHAVVRAGNGEIIAFPLAATIGSNSFTGRLEHEGDARRPWKFDLRTGKLSLEDGAQWFEALGHRNAPPSILDLLPGLRSLDTRRVAASNLFNALNAKGVLHASAITYRPLALVNPEATVEISGRVVRVTDSTFRAAGGRGHATLEVDLNAQPARVTGSVAVDQSILQTLAPGLPASLRGVRGLASATARFETRGLTRQEAVARLEGEAAVKLEDVSLGDFDLLGALVEQCHWGTLEPARRRATVRAATLTLRVRDRRVMLKSSPIELAGARIEAVGSYSFDGRFDVGVHTDFTHLARRWQAPASATVSPSLAASNAPAGLESEGLLANAHLVGPLDKLEVVPGAQTARSGLAPD